MIVAKSFIILLLFATCLCNPIFFDLLESSTTQSDVISDYRHNKRADSNEHEAKPKESRVEFYAKNIGKLLGSVRNSIRMFIADVKKGTNQLENESTTMMTILEDENNLIQNSTSKIHVIQSRTLANSDRSDSSKEFESIASLIIDDESGYQPSFLKLIQEKIKDDYKNITTLNITCLNFISDHASLLEAIRVYKKEKNLKYQEKARIALQQLFYKYARIYLIARKGFKDFESLQKYYEKKSTESHKLENENENLKAEKFTTNDASRHNFNSLESIAILVFELIGTVIALTLGLWSHLEQFEWTSFEFN